MRARQSARMKDDEILGEGMRMGMGMGMLILSVHLFKREGGDTYQTIKPRELMHLPRLAYALTGPHVDHPFSTFLLLRLAPLGS